MQAAVEFILQLQVEVEVEVGKGISKESKNSSYRNRKKSKKMSENSDCTTPLTVRAESKSSDMKKTILLKNSNIIVTEEIDSISTIQNSTSFSTLASTSPSTIPIHLLYTNYSLDKDHIRMDDKCNNDTQYDDGNNNDDNNDNDDGKKNDKHNNSNSNSNSNDDNINQNDSNSLNNNDISLSNSSSSSRSSNITSSRSSSNLSTQPQSRSDVTHHYASTSDFSESAAAAAIVKLGIILS